MNDQNQKPTPNSNAPPPMYRDWHEQRSAERMARREARWQRRGHYGWFGGAILILLGVIFLLENMGIPFVENWWALFILIPGFGAYVAAWEMYHDKGQLTRGGAWTLTVAILLTILALFFLMNLTINPFWPVLLIVAGFALLGTAWLPG